MVKPKPIEKTGLPNPCKAKATWLSVRALKKIRKQFGFGLQFLVQKGFGFFVLKDSRLGSESRKTFTLLALSFFFKSLLLLPILLNYFVS